MKLLSFTLMLSIISCGSDDSEVITKEQLPLPIPPISRPPQVPVPQTPRPPSRHINPQRPLLTHGDYLNRARQMYPHIVFREIYGNNASTQLIGPGRYMISMGTQLRQTVDADQYALILNHEIAHTLSYVRGSEVLADFYSIYRMRLMNRRLSDRYLDQVARRNARWLSRKPRSREHPTPSKRLRIYRKAIRREKLSKLDHYYYR